MMRNRKFRQATRSLFILSGCFFSSSLLLAEPSNIRSDEYRFTVYPYHDIAGDLKGFGQFGYAFNPEAHYQRYIMDWPGLTYTVNNWFQLWGGLYTTYTDYQSIPDTYQLEPFFGPKLFVPNPWKWNIYNYTRYEHLDTLSIGTGHWSDENRFRSRFGVEFPLTSIERAWKPKTWYGLADVEPFFRLDHDDFDPVVLRAGGGYIVNDRLRIEFIYSAQFSRLNDNGPLQFTQNSFRINVRIGLSKGILGAILHESASGD